MYYLYSIWQLYKSASLSEILFYLTYYQFFWVAHLFYSNPPHEEIGVSELFCLKDEEKEEKKKEEEEDEEKGQEED